MKQFTKKITVLISLTLRSTQSTGFKINATAFRIWSDDKLREVYPTNNCIIVKRWQQHL